MKPSKNIASPGLPVTMTIPSFCIWSSNGRSKVYDMIRDRKIETVRIGHRQLIITESYLRLIAESRTTDPVPAHSAAKPAKQPIGIARASDPGRGDAV